MAVELIAFHLKRIKTGKKSHDSKRWKRMNTGKPGWRAWSEGGRGRKQPCLYPCLCWVDAVQELYTRHPTSSSRQAL